MKNYEITLRNKYTGAREKQTVMVPEYYKNKMDIEVYIDNEYQDTEYTVLVIKEA